MAVSSSPPCPSSSGGRRCRLLEVKIKSANLNTKKNGMFYVKLWIDQDAKLQTKRVYCNNGSNPVWNQRFVFAVPHTIVSENKPSLWFEVFRARKWFKDSCIGKSEGKVELKNNCNKEEDKIVKYDTENEEEEDDGEEGGEKEVCELKGSVSFRVEKGLEEKGEMSVEMVVWKGYLSRVGNCKWKHWAMDYDEFMGLKEVEWNKKKNKNKNKHLCMCFANDSTKD